MRHWLGHSLVVVAAATFGTACADDAALGPGSPDESAAASVSGQVSAAPPWAQHGGVGRAVDLGTCDSLEAPSGTRLAARMYAQGVQIYRWTGSSWSFVAPSAVLSADPQGNGIVGTHYAGPTWESGSGSKVIGAVLKRCTPDASAIPWLLLQAVSTEGPGIFHQVTYIQRVNTVGGNAPSNPGNTPGEEAEVPYTTVYLFYRG
jgi:hypothetical protein